MYSCTNGEPADSGVIGKGGLLRGLREPISPTLERVAPDILLQEFWEFSGGLMRHERSEDCDSRVSHCGLDDGLIILEFPHDSAVRDEDCK